MSQKKASFSHVRSIRPLTISEDVKIEVEVLDTTSTDTVADNFDFMVNRTEFHSNMTSVSSFSSQKPTMSEVEDYSLDPMYDFVEPVLVPATDDEKAMVALKDMDLDEVPDPAPDPKPPTPARKIGHHRMVKLKPKKFNSAMMGTSTGTVAKPIDPLDVYYKAYQQLAKAIIPMPRRCYFPLWKQRLEQAATSASDGTYVAPFEEALRAQIALNKQAGIYPAAITPVDTGVVIPPPGPTTKKGGKKPQQNMRAPQKKGPAHQKQGKGAHPVPQNSSQNGKKPQVTPKTADKSSSDKFAMTLEYHKEVMKEFLKCQ
jgi:hypothetical protein